MTCAKYHFTRIAKPLSNAQMFQRNRTNTPGDSTTKLPRLGNSRNVVGVVLITIFFLVGFQAAAQADRSPTTTFHWSIAASSTAIEDSVNRSTDHRHPTKTATQDPHSYGETSYFQLTRVFAKSPKFNHALYFKTPTSATSDGSQTTKPFKVTSTGNAVPVLNERVFSARVPRKNTINVGQLIDIRLTDLFAQADSGDAVECCTASTSNESTLLVVKTKNGDVATLVGRSSGKATLTLIATNKANNTTVVAIDLTINASPKESMPVGPQSLTRVAPIVLDVSTVFTDPDHNVESLRIAAQATGDGADRIILSLVDAKLAIIGVKGTEPSDVEVKLYAVDPFGASATSTFVATIKNLNPTLENAQTLNIDPLNLAESVTIDLSETFSDQDGEIASIAAFVPENSAIGVSGIDLPGGLLTLTGLLVGEANITLTATDNDGGMVETSFQVAVKAD